VSLHGHCRVTNGWDTRCGTDEFQMGPETATERAEVTGSGRLFHTRAAATGKARSPTVDSRVRLTVSDEDELERILVLYTL